MGGDAYGRCSAQACAQSPCPNNHAAFATVRHPALQPDHTRRRLPPRWTAAAHTALHGAPSFASSAGFGGWRRRGSGGSMRGRRRGAPEADAARATRSIRLNIVMVATQRKAWKSLSSRDLGSRARRHAARACPLRGCKIRISRAALVEGEVLVWPFRDWLAPRHRHRLQNSLRLSFCFLSSTHTRAPAASIASDGTQGGSGRSQGGP